MFRFSFFLFSLLAVAALPAQVVINEVCASNLNGITDTYGDREDWFELYNTGGAAVDLSGWFLSDDPAVPQKWMIPVGQSILPGAYRRVFCSGRGQVAGTDFHTSFKLTQTNGESVVLTDPGGNTVDQFTFTVPNQVNQSYGRWPNGAATWKILTTPTAGTSNSGASYTAYAPDVQADMPAGFYAAPFLVTLSSDPNVVIRYTTNGSDPTAAAATVYTNPVLISATTVLKARAFSLDNQVLPGFVMTNTYFINVSHAVPVVSLSGSQVFTLFGGSQITPSGSLEYFENQERKASGIGELNKHGNDSWAYPQRGVDWITRDQMGYEDELKEQIFPDSPRKKFQRLILKAAANDNYPSAGGAHVRDAFIHTLATRGGLNLDVRISRSCVVYLNGQYWGVYELREKADDADFTKYYYDQDEFDIDYIKTWGNTWNEYGSDGDWVTLRNYIMGNNMAVPANYSYVEQRLDVLSLIDYVIMNQHTVNKDWLNYNTAWWRGRNPDGGAQRWRYTLWDLDASFGHYINYTGIPNTGPTADPCDVEQIFSDPEGHIDVFMALFNSPTFKDLYVNRYADLLNGPLSCANMNALLSEMTNEIAPEMPQHCARWGGSVPLWQQNVQTLRNFINSRCPVLNGSIVDCYQVTGPFPLQVLVMPVASPNQVMVNTIIPTAYPYTGDYFGGVNINLVAQAATGWIFDHWEVNGNVFLPNQDSAAIALAFETGGTATAFFVEDNTCADPQDFVLAGTPDMPVLSWTAPPSATGFNISFQKTTDFDVQEFYSEDAFWNLDSLLACGLYEMQIQAVCPAISSNIVDYSFEMPNLLDGYALADISSCNVPSAILDAGIGGATYQWDDNTTLPQREVTATGDYWVRVQWEDCEITDTVVVALYQTTATVQPVLCPGENYSLQGEIFDEQNLSGAVIMAGMAAGGCDSIVQVNVQYLAASRNDIFQTSCDPAASGVDTLHLTNAVGCDSMVVTTTNYVPYSQTLIAATSCNPALAGTDTLVLLNYRGCDSLVITTTSFDAQAISVTQLLAQNCDAAMVGVDTLLLNNAAGCDSLVITTTTLALKSQTLLAATSCNPALVGTDTLTLSNYHGCDSLVITTTTFDPLAISVTQLSAQNCDAAMVGVDTLLLNNAAGCDSLVITTTTLAPKSQTLLAATSCNPALVGIDTLTLSNYHGCDSLVITTTSFDPFSISVTQLSAQNCDAAMVGVDTILLNNTAGCDSLVITTTSLAPESQTLLAATSCNPALVGTDTLTLSNYHGCDSLVITTTSFDPFSISVTQLSAQNCDPAMVGVDTVLLNNLAGCDSLVITTTSLLPGSLTAQSGITCDPALAGTDTLILSNHYGCDSLVVRTLDYAGFDLAISKPAALCHGAQDGWIQIDTAFSAKLPVLLELQGQLAQTYNGIPVQWENLKPGIYEIIATNPDDCILEQSVEISETDPLVIDAGASVYSVHLGDSVLVEMNANFPVNNIIWEPSTGVACPECAATLVSPLVTSLYQITAWDANGCVATGRVTVHVEDGIRVFVSNIFIPNDPQTPDGLTVFAGPEVVGLRAVRLFDRWGNLIFQQMEAAPNQPTNWDGTWHGNALSPGVYIWTCEVLTLDGKVTVKSGDITVLR